jgi:uncharacterized protein (TIGR00288 family)
MAEDQWVILIDFDNLKADPLVIAEVIRERGRVVLARAYGDAMRDQKFREVFLEANVEIIDRPRLNRADHRGNDIRLAIDAVEFALQYPNVTHFALVTGDTDFIPVVNRLKLYGKYVAIIGSKKNTSPRLIEASDVFLCYEDLVREEVLLTGDFQERAEALYRKALDTLREQGGTPGPARIERMIARIDPGFRWRRGGFLEFIDFLGWVQKKVEREESESPARPGDLAGKEIHAFNLLLRALDQLHEEGAKPAPARVREQMLAFDPAFDEAHMGHASFAAFLERMAGTGKLSHGKTFVRLDAEFAWLRGLKRLQITPWPGLLDDFLTAFEAKVAEAAEGDEPSLGEIASRVKKSLRVANQRINDLCRSVKFSGALQPPTGEGYVTFNLPFRLVAHGEELRRMVLKGYLRKLAGVRPFKRADLPLLAVLVLGSDGESGQDLLLELAREMVRDGRLAMSGNAFHYVAS